MTIWKFRIEFRYVGNVVKYFKNKPTIEDLIPIIDSSQIEVYNLDTKLDTAQIATISIEKLSEMFFDFNGDYIEFTLNECELIDN